MTTPTKRARWAGAHASIGGVRTVSAKSTIACRDGVFSTAHSVSSLVRAIPWAAMRFLFVAERRHKRRIDQWLLLVLRTAALAGGAAKYHEKNAGAGKLFARERIALLMDHGSFVEDGSIGWVETDRDRALGADRLVGDGFGWRRKIGVG